MRESDALVYLWLAYYYTTLSGVSLLCGIATIFAALVPVLYTTVGTKLTIALIVIVCTILIPVAISMDFLRKKRHAGYYFMKGNHHSGVKDMENHDPYDPVLAIKLLEAHAQLGCLMAARDKNKTGDFVMIPTPSVVGHKARQQENFNFCTIVGDASLNHSNYLASFQTDISDYLNQKSCILLVCHRALCVTAVYCQSTEISPSDEHPHLSKKICLTL